MRKIAISILCMILFALNQPAFSSPTIKRGAFELCQLYAQRLTQYQNDYNVDYDQLWYQGPGLDYGNGESAISVASGHMVVDKSDYSVNSNSILLYDLDADNEENIKNTICAIIALSALEYGYYEEVSSENLTNAGIYTPSPVNKALAIYRDEISAILKDGAFVDALRKPEEEIKVYSANYDYYIMYFEYTSSNDNDKTVRCFDLVARCHD